jgi:DNA-binding transcriptional LysR family regulator
MIDLKRLRLIRELALRGTMTSVAQALGLSSSAVSQQLAILEREVRQKLWEQIGRGVRLTPEGERLAARAEQIFQAVDAMEAEFQAPAGESGGRLAVGCFPSFAKTRLLPAIVDLRDRRPGIAPALFELEPESALEALERGACDVAIIYRYNIVPRPVPENLHAVPLLEEPMMLALPKGNSVLSDPVPLSRLAGADWIVGSRQSDDHVLLERACGWSGFIAKIGHSVDDYDLVLQMIAAGLGVGFVPESMRAAAARNDVALCRLQGPALTREVTALVRPALRRSPTLQAFLSALA